MVLSETCARWRSLSLVLVIRGGLWLGECLGETACQANGPPETSPRTIGSDRTRTSTRSPALGIVVRPSPMSFASSALLDPRVLFLP